MWHLLPPHLPLFAHPFDLHHLESHAPQLAFKGVAAFQNGMNVTVEGDLGAPVDVNDGLFWASVPGSLADLYHGGNPVESVPSAAESVDAARLKVSAANPHHGIGFLHTTCRAVHS